MLPSTIINKMEKLDDDLYMITEATSVHCYLIIGTEKAVLFDMGYGYENIIPLIKKITSLPIVAIMSHGDPDHGLGAGYCKEAYIHELDYGKLLQNDNSYIRGIGLDYRYSKMPEILDAMDKEAYLNMRTRDTYFHFLRDSDEIDLGEIKLRVLHIPGHSYGHIALLDEKNGRLFSGDMVTWHNVWYFLKSDEQAPFIMAKHSYEKLKSLADEGKFNKIYPAHNKVPIDTSILDEYLECFNGEFELNYLKDKKFNSFMGKGYQHLYKHINIIYSDDRLLEYLNKPIKR